MNWSIDGYQASPTKPNSALAVWPTKAKMHQGKEILIDATNLTSLTTRMNLFIFIQKKIGLYNKIFNYKNLFCKESKNYTMLCCSCSFYFSYNIYI